MFNQNQVSIGTFYTAEYYEYDEATEDYANGIQFKYKTYDDVQYRETRTQPQSGALGSRFSVSIKTYANLPFKVKDKVILLNDDRYYEVTGVGELQNVGVSLANSMFPLRKGNKPKLIHLNKDIT